MSLRRALLDLLPILANKYTMECSEKDVVITVEEIPEKTVTPRIHFAPMSMSLVTTQAKTRGQKKKEEEEEERRKESSSKKAAKPPSVLRYTLILLRTKQNEYVECNSCV